MQLISAWEINGEEHQDFWLLASPLKHEAALYY